jgi:hypothetical protein
MKKNQIMASIAIAALAVGIITIARNAQYQEEKKAAWLEAYPLKSSCALKSSYQRLDILSRRNSEAKPDNVERRDEAEQVRKRAESLSEQCKKVRDYEIKYNDIIDRSTY